MASAPDRLLQSPTRKGTVVAVNLLIAAAHVVDLKRAMPAWARVLHSSYFSDIAIPFGFYFLLCLVDDRAAWLRPTWAKAATVFVGCAAAEFGQAIGIPVLGRTFDPLDFVMYAVGVSLALAVDALVFSRLLTGWRLRAPQ